MKKILIPICIIFILSTTGFADITIGILPAKGNKAKLAEISDILKKQLHEFDGISIVADDVMWKIMEVHKRSMALGSSYHDIAKLKIAEYLVSLTIQGNNLSLVLVDVNSGTEVFRDLMRVSGNMTYKLKSSCSKMRYKLLMRQGNRRTKIPEDAQAYFNLVKNYTASISRGDAATYPYLAFFHVDKYKHPAANNPTLVQSAKILNQVIKRKLIRAKLTYLYMKPKAPLVYITVLAKKFGKKIQITFAVAELDDGSLGIISYKIKR